MPHFMDKRRSRAQRLDATFAINDPGGSRRRGERYRDRPAMRSSRLARHAAIALATGMICAAQPALAADCKDLLGERGGNVVVTTATPIAAGDALPIAAGPGHFIPVTVAFCRVEGKIEGNIGFEMWLPTPEVWNHRLLGAGVGGDAGSYNDVDLARRVADGFAGITTDSGHKQANTHWMADPKAREDYAHRATHLALLAAKALAAAYYAAPVAHSYFLGCSGGGRQGLKEMEDYPGDYDGIVAGAPGPYMPLISVRMMWFSLLQKRDPAGALTDADWALYEKSANAACDRLDGVADGVVENPLRCGFRPAALACAPGARDGCLPAAKLHMLETIVAPMRDERGRPMDLGLLPGVRTRPGPPSPLLHEMWADAVYNNPAWDETTFRRTADLAAINRVMPELRADSTRIAPFIARGGKAIIYQGWQDPSVIAGSTIAFYRRLQAAQGGPAALARSVRLFMVPGMYHCGNGPGVDQFGGAWQASAPGDPTRDVLWSVIDWVENHRAPASLVGAHVVDGHTQFTRRLCPFPATARYDGKGDPAVAASYTCVRDAALAAYP